MVYVMKMEMKVTINKEIQRCLINLRTPGPFFNKLLFLRSFHLVHDENHLNRVSLAKAYTFTSCQGSCLRLGFLPSIPFASSYPIV